MEKSTKCTITRNFIYLSEETTIPSRVIDLSVKRGHKSTFSPKLLVGGGHVFKCSVQQLVRLDEFKFVVVD